MPTWEKSPIWQLGIHKLTPAPVTQALFLDDDTFDFRNI